MSSGYRTPDRPTLYVNTVYYNLHCFPQNDVLAFTVLLCESLLELAPDLLRFCRGCQNIFANWSLDINDTFGFSRLFEGL